MLASSQGGEDVLERDMMGRVESGCQIPVLGTRHILWVFLKVLVSASGPPRTIPPPLPSSKFSTPLLLKLIKC